MPRLGISETIELAWQRHLDLARATRPDLLWGGISSIHIATNTSRLRCPTALVSLWRLPPMALCTGKYPPSIMLYDPDTLMLRSCSLYETIEGESFDEIQAAVLRLLVRVVETLTEVRDYFSPV